VVTTSQPLPLGQATFSLRLLSQWISWLSLVEVARHLDLAAAAVLVVIVHQFQVNLQEAEQVQNRL
jgi:hypothetical protein